MAVAWSLSTELMNQPTFFLRFDTEEQWREAALEHGVLEVTEEGEDIWTYYTQRWAVDDIGYFYDLANPEVVLDGYHVNLKWLGDEMPVGFSLRKIYPVTPRRIFYGDDLEAIAAAAYAATP